MTPFRNTGRPTFGPLAGMPSLIFVSFERKASLFGSIKFTRKLTEMCLVWSKVELVNPIGRLTPAGTELFLVVQNWASATPGNKHTLTSAMSVLANLDKVVGQEIQLTEGVFDHLSKVLREQITKEWRI